MSGNKSRLGKGLGALFPALPGEDALADASNNVQFNVSHETKTAIVNSSNYITTDSRVGKLMTKMGIALENMEFYSVLSVAKEFHLPARGIFCVTNHTDSAAHETFIKRHAEAMKLLDSYVRTHYAEYL